MAWEGLLLCIIQMLRMQVRLRIGMYYPFLADWLRVFPAEQVMVIRYEDYIATPSEIINNVCKFLGIRKKISTLFGLFVPPPGNFQFRSCDLVSNVFLFTVFCLIWQNNKLRKQWLSQKCDFIRPVTA